MTPPVSPALREAVAREIDPHAFTYGEADYYGPSLDKACDSARLRVALKKAEAILSGPIASEIARLTGERDDALGAAALNLAQLKNWRRQAEAAEARLASAAEEIAGLKRKLEDAEALAKSEKRSADMYANAWVRELGGKLFPKSHHIDACVVTTRWMKERSDRLAVIEADQKAAALIGEYGPSNEMIRARAAITPKETGHE